MAAMVSQDQSGECDRQKPIACLVMDLHVVNRDALSDGSPCCIALMIAYCRFTSEKYSTVANKALEISFTEAY